MEVTQKFLIGLKKALRTRGIGYRDLTRVLGLSESSVKRLLSGSARGLTLERIGAVCEFARIPLPEVLRLGALDDEPDFQPLTHRQEETLLKIPRLLSFFHLLNRGLTASDLPRFHELADAEVQRHILALERLELAEKRPGTGARLTHPAPVRYREQGPILNKARAQARERFLEGPFAGSESSLEVEFVRCKPETLRRHKRRLAEWMDEFRRDVAVDLRNPGPEPLVEAAALGGLRPMDLPLFNEIPPKTGALPQA